MQDAENINKFMEQARKNFEYHLLSEIDDEYACEVYLILLMSVAETMGQFDETHNNPISYICGIAVALNVELDMQEIFRRSLLIDEQNLSEYAQTLNQHDIQNLFLFDALKMSVIYSKSDTKTIEYLTGLSYIFGLEKTGLKEISIIVKAVMNNTKSFRHKFKIIKMQAMILSLFRLHFKNIFVETSDAFVIEYDKRTDVTEKLPQNISEKDYILLRNGYIHDKKKLFKISHCGKVQFVNCRFYNMEYLSDETMFYFDDIYKVEFIDCKFENLIGKRDGDLSSKERIHPKVIFEGIIAYLKYTEIFFIRASFKNCYYLDDVGNKLGRIGYTCFGGIPVLPGSLICSQSFYLRPVVPTEYFNHTESCKFEESAMIAGDSFFHSDFSFHKKNNSDDENAGFWTYVYTK